MTKQHITTQQESHGAARRRAFETANEESGPDTLLSFGTVKVKVFRTVLSCMTNDGLAAAWVTGDVGCDIVDTPMGNQPAVVLTVVLGHLLHRKDVLACPQRERP